MQFGSKAEIKFIRVSIESCWEKGPTNLGIEESVTAFPGDSDPVMVSLEFALDA